MQRRVERGVRVSVRLRASVRFRVTYSAGAGVRVRGMVSWISLTVRGMVRVTVRVMVRVRVTCSAE